MTKDYIMLVTNLGISTVYSLILLRFVLQKVSSTLDQIVKDIRKLIKLLKKGEDEWEEEE